MEKKHLLYEANYYYITDQDIDLSPTEQAQIAVENGIKILQYREKSKSDRELYFELKDIVDICGDKTLLIVNDRVDLALSVGADGVHLGQDDLPPERVKEFVEDMLVGVSTHNIEQAKQYQDIADYIGIGPVHQTETKEDADPELGIEKAKNIAEIVEVPTVAIGGIEESDLKTLAESFDMICAISSVTRKGELSDRIRYFEEKIDDAKRR